MEELVEEDVPAFPVRVWLNTERTEWDEVWPGDRLQIHGISSDPQPGIPNYYEATVKSTARVSGMDCMVLHEHKRHNTDAAYREPDESIALDENSSNIRRFVIIRRSRKKQIVRKPKPTGA